MTVAHRLAQRAAASLVALLVLVACGQGGQQGPVDSKRLFATAKPGTMLVLGNFKAHLTVPDAQLDEARFEFLKNKAVDMAVKGQLPADPNVLSNWIIDQVLGDPLSYFQPTQQLRQTDVELVAQGSGFAISPDGYIVTNAHVVAPDEDELKQQLAANGLKTFIDQDVQDFIKSAGSQATPDLVQKVTQAVTVYNTKYLQVAKLDRAFFVQVGAAIPGVAIGSKNIAAELSAAGQQIPGKDVAILKVERKDLPTVPLGDDTQLNTGEKVYVLGYPGAATFHPVLSEQSQIEPSMTSGTLSAKKTMPGGWNVLQIDAPITHGNSGGPVFDADGKVVGIATFGSIDPNTGKEVQGFNFAVPISLAREFINKSGGKPQEGIVTQKYNDAIDLYDKHWYSDALSEFQQVNSLSPGHPYVQQYITDSQTAIAQGKDRSNEKYLPFLFVGIPLALLVVAGVVVLAVLLTRRRGRPEAPAYAGGGGAGYQLQQPQYPSQLPPGGQSAYQQAPPGQGSSPPPAPAQPPAQPVTYGQPGAAPPAEPEAPGEAKAGAQQVRFCSNCGNNVTGKAFCDRCGKPTGL